METKALDYVDNFNLIVCPCVSPWGYETINRWNWEAIDPNRSFRGEGLCQESKHLISFVSSFEKRDDVNIIAHIDLHETTNTDETIFRPALEARDAIKLPQCGIPDGFYLVGISTKVEEEYFKAVINGVKEITHIAPPDQEGKLLDEKILSEGVIVYGGDLGLCNSMTKGSKYVVTTEVYPDSSKPNVDDENCILAQVKAVTSTLDFIYNKSKLDSSKEL